MSDPARYPEGSPIASPGGRRGYRPQTKICIATAAGLLTLSAVGAAGIVGMSQVNTRAQALYLHAAVPLSDFAAMRDAVGDNRVATLAMLRAVTPQQQQDVTAEAAVADRAVDSALVAYLAAHHQDLGPQRTAVVDEFKIRYATWRRLRGQMFDAVRSGDLTAASQIYDTTLMAANSAYAQETDRLGVLEAHDVPTTAAAAAHTYRVMRTVMLVVLILGAVLSLGLGFAVSRILQVALGAQAARRDSEYFRELALRDPLTGLNNRRFINEHLAELLHGCANDGRVFSVALLDLDHFKEINDILSHDVGDAVLVEFAGLLTAVTQRPAVAARLGGEEFLAILPDLGEAAAEAWTSSTLEAIRSHDWSPITGALPVTASAGLSTARGADWSRGRLLSQADENLYAAKHAGRDRLVGPRA